jgi:long-chain acyl-CoA synthetase
MATYNFAGLIRNSADRFPSKLALITSNVSLTYKELASRVNQAGNLFLDYGVRAGDRVSILFVNDYRFFELCFGLMSIGAIPVPMNAKLGTDTLAYVYNNSGSKLIIYHEELRDKAQILIKQEQIDDHFVCANSAVDHWEYDYDTKLANQSDELELYAAQGKDICFLPYTSGSTGNPKGCRLTHEGQLWNVQTMSELRGIDESDRVLISLPLYHKNAMGTLKSVFYTGASAVILPRVDPAQIVRAIDQYSCTYMTGVPAMYRMIVNYLKEHHGAHLKSLRFGICGSSDTPKELLDDIRALLHIPIYEGYGLTEGGPVVLESRATHFRLGSAGIPVPGCRIRIVDEQGIDVSFGTVGELWVSNPGITDGYWNLPEVTAKRITADGWLKTGDVVWQDEDDFVYIVGRKDDMINVGGENVYPKEVENILLKHPLVADVCVLPMQHELKGEVPIAFIISSPEGQVDEEELKAYFISRGPAYAHPRKIFYIDAFPLTGPGKLDRPQLKKQLEQLLTTKGEI